MAKIYTRTGDKGTTGLVGGRRLPKDDLLFDAIGTGDELCAVLGTVPRTENLNLDMYIHGVIGILQDDLFTIGAILAGAQTLNIPTTEHMEEAIDNMTEELEPLRNFILPGGHPMAAHLHLARAVSRRYERSLVGVCKAPYPYGQGLLVWANRTSDLLFTMARWVNATEGRQEAIWKAQA